MSESATSYGLLAEFDDASRVVKAARAVHEAGYREMDAFSPYALEELAEAIGFHRTRLPLIVLAGGLLGGLSGFLMQYWVHVIEYPLNIGGRPFNSWPSFIIITFEMTILFAAGSAVLGMLALNGLPRPHHPLFNSPEFKLASQNRFFICVQSRDPKFDARETRELLENLGGKVTDVPLE
jgi:hypothetical protein